MTPESAARIFHDWAEQEGLFSDGPRARIQSTQEEMTAVQPVSEPGKQALRSKQIQAVGFDDSRREVIVFLKRAAPRSKKALSLLPSRINGVKISYRQGSPDTVGHLPPAPFGSPPYSVRQTSNGDRYTCGSSISVGNCRDAGTLGCLVRDSQNTLYGLSNNHVSASCSFAGVELPIVAPGVCDVAPRGLPPFTIGFHSRSLTFVAGSADNVEPKKNLDAAIFRIRDEGLVTSFQGHAHDTPDAVGPLVPGMVVEKVGRTTGHTKGQVISCEF